MPTARTRQGGAPVGAAPQMTSPAQSPPGGPDRAERRAARRRAPSNRPLGRSGGTTGTAPAAAFGAPDFCDCACVDEPTAQRARAAMKPWVAVAALADTFKVLGDPTRLRIAFALAREELCVCDLAAVLGVSQSVVSHSLRALRHMGVVRYRRAGKIVYYALDDAHIARLIDEGFRHVEERAPQPQAAR